MRWNVAGRSEHTSNSHGIAERGSALCGAMSVVLLVVGTVLSDNAGRGLHPGQTPEELAAGFAEHADQNRVGAALLGVAAVLGLIFLGPLWARLHTGSPWLAMVAVCGGVAGVAGTLVVAAFVIGGTTAGEYGDGQTARMVLIMQWDTARVAVPPFLATVAAATLAGFRYGVFDRAFCWFSLVFTVLLTAALVPVGPAGLMGVAGGLWIVVASLVLTFESSGQLAADD